MKNKHLKSVSTSKSFRAFPRPFAAFTAFCALFLTATIFSCASTSSLKEGEELVEYKKNKYEVLNKKELTEEELRQDCDMLKYILYNCYAGIDEAIANGFDLNSTIDEIYSQALTKKSVGKIPTGDFTAVIHDVMAKNLTNTDQHVSIGGRSIKPNYAIYYTNIFMQKRDGKFYVKEIREVETENKKSAVKAQENPDVKIGMEFTGSESNLYEFMTPGGLEYRYGVFTNKSVRTVQISLEGKNYPVPTSNEKPISSKYAWTGLKTTNDTLYMSLGDCRQVNGIGEDAENKSFAWDNFTASIRQSMEGKKNIIFDLRSNPGGRFEYPAKMLTSAYYYKTTDKEKIRDIEKLFSIIATQDMTEIVSPFTMQTEKELYEKKWKVFFDQMDEERKTYLKNYWKHMKSRPIRTQIPIKEYSSTLTAFPEPDFKGDIYILINRGTASASEYGTDMAYFLREQGINVHLIGENSWGAYKYGGMNGNSLPNSGIYVSCGLYFGESPSIKQNKNWLGEGIGFKPDYYAVNDTILSTLILLTKDVELADTLKGLDKEQL